MINLSISIQNSSFIISTVWWRQLPAVNASLNGSSAVLLLGAFVMIKQRKYTAHATLMIAAFVTSTVFLACYVIYHWLNWLHGELVTPFPPGPWRPWYLAVLIPHVVLAFVILPLIFTSFYLAWKRRWKAHHQVSSVTLPLWLYVSVTGVLVYLMLYKLAPTLGH